jgi:hypothetical protein
MSQVPLFPAPRFVPPAAPPPKPAQAPYVPDVEGARLREARLVSALRSGPGTLEDILRRPHHAGLAPLTQSATLADLRCLADEGVIEQHIVYALPGQRVEVR